MPHLDAPVIYRESRNRLTRHAWIFGECKGGLRLTWYGYERRTTTKHPWQITKCWDILGVPYGDMEWLRPEEVVWDQDVQEDLMASLLSQLVIVGPPVDVSTGTDVSPVGRIG